MEKYFENLKREIDKVYDISNKAKKSGKDVELFVESPQASDKNNRCIDIISTIYPKFNEFRNQIIDRILKLEEVYGVGADEVALEISKEIAEEKFFRFSNKEEAICAGLRFGCAYNTKGVVGAPIEGITNVRIDQKDNFLYIYYAGPIRTAGGTAQVFTLFIADYIRKALGLNRYIPTKEERERYYTEITDYITYVTRKQYKPSEEEVDFLVKNVPVCITGEPTEKREVSKHKELERVETTRIRGGMCLIYLDGLPLKAEKLFKKLKKYGEKFGLTDSWSWLEDFIKLKKKKKENKEKGGYKFLEEVPAGRPVYSMPNLTGGFRLRYGRSRNTGYGCFGFHPATLHILDSFPAIASQMKIELPGKSCTVGVCDTIEGPVVKLKSGEVIKITSVKEAEECKNNIEKILFVGDVLVSYGDFLENGVKLIPSPYTEELWRIDLKKFSNLNFNKRRFEELLKNPYNISEEEALNLAEQGVPLHPKFIYFYNHLSKEELINLTEFINSGDLKDGKLIIKNDERIKLLEKAVIPYLLSSDRQYIIVENGRSLLKTFENIQTEKILDENEENIYKLISKFSKYIIKDKVTKYIGARMGRPEKAQMRKMKGSPQVLFPVGQKGGRMRNLAEVDYLITEISVFSCPEHGDSIYPFCIRCGKHLRNPKIMKKQINVKGLLNECYNKLKGEKFSIIKGVRGVSSKHKIPEPIEKGILRAKYGLYVFRDGTIRYDMVNAPLTHFKPKEIGTSVEKLRELGYEKDIYGNPLERDDQILELFPQDFIISTYGEESAADYFLRVSKFIDEELEKFYGVGKFYNAKRKEDLIGHLFLDIAPHTISPVVCRLIGFTDNRCHYAHPYLFAATRRDCDGEENGVLFLMDTLLNFSREYLPEKRGSISDAPLSITTLINLEEVDDEVYDMDIVFEYPEEFYLKCEERAYPWEIKVRKVGDILKDNNHCIGFTIDTLNINHGVHITKYKEVGDMVDKVMRQIELAKRLNAVDEKFVAQKIISSHFLKDVKGNLRTFFKQTFRCISCNTIYRRPPLRGICLKCKGNLVLTVSEGTISKYIEASRKIAEYYHISDYYRQQLELLQTQLENLFGKKARQKSLSAF
ncbi:MAG: DNA polymerase II large subunit [Candidatus Aenigmarchaeota archaeon ex4484_56]|nr:MAG: DNA polymerase II large subunit [Candidatus Aenigmarchaeota archaeon ex4484_56]